jgi:hypothetical protein
MLLKFARETYIDVKITILLFGYLFWLPALEFYLALLASHTCTFDSCGIKLKKKDKSLVFVIPQQLAYCFILVIIDVVE